ncbi:hypothetical protein CDD83_10997 [Cordyceps sp. RAO-2017]|nr:hypothetical protein CDD83_10997 [Cordyceps sp. RAO-2017]
MSNLIPRPLSLSLAIVFPLGSPAEENRMGSGNDLPRSLVPTPSREQRPGVPRAWSTVLRCRLAAPRVTADSRQPDDAQDGAGAKDGSARAARDCPKTAGEGGRRRDVRDGRADERLERAISNRGQPCTAPFFADPSPRDTRACGVGLGATSRRPAVRDAFPGPVRAMECRGRWAQAGKRGPLASVRGKGSPTSRFGRRLSAARLGYPLSAPGPVEERPAGRGGSFHLAPSLSGLSSASTLLLYGLRTVGSGGERDGASSTQNLMLLTSSSPLLSHVHGSDEVRWKALGFWPSLLFVVRLSPAGRRPEMLHLHLSISTPGPRRRLRFAMPMRFFSTPALPPPPPAPFRFPGSTFREASILLYRRALCTPARPLGPVYHGCEEAAHVPPPTAKPQDGPN